MSLLLDWCSHEAAKYAVEKWHYSKTMPAGKMARVGVWEDEKYIGCVLFSRGANNNIGKPYRLDQTQVCELTRVALSQHYTPVSRIGAIGIKMLLKQSPGLRLIVSYADPSEGHHGGIYQAMGWTYAGLADATRGYEYFVNGERVRTRTLSAAYGTRSDKVLSAVLVNAEKRKQVRKHKYLYPLDAAMRAQIAPLAQPYPKRATRAASIDSDAPGLQPGEGGADPTAALQQDEVA
jgi:hypothetical protein